MEIRWDRKDGALLVEGRRFPCTCDVRNELNGRRARDQVVRTIPNGMPYYPRPFPTGTWNVLRPRERDDGYRAPYFIPTTAYQEVPTWELDENAHYLEPTGEVDLDREYGLHWSEDSRTTLGCIRISRKDDLLALVVLINAALDRPEPVRLIVPEAS
jgi:hypothetical protein